MSIDSDDATVDSASPIVTDDEAEVGVLEARPLPDREFRALWDAIIIDQRIKDRLLAHAVMNFSIRTRVDRAKLPLHGLILMVGPPGTGKTSLARGLAARTAELMPELGPFNFIEVDPHGMASSSQGKSQRAVQQLLGVTVARRAATAPTIVLLDEVETLAAARARLSLEANPIDVHRATDAVLAQLDHLAASIPRLLFIATSNFPEAVDLAFISRADFTATINRPAPKVCREIFMSSVEALADHFPAIKEIVSHPDVEHAAELCKDIDGRSIRKIVLAACTISLEAALDPNQVTPKDFLKAVQRAKREQRLLALQLTDE